MSLNSGWVTANVLPFEAELRAGMRRLCATPDDVDDLVQEVYCRLLRSASVEHIATPRAFAMQVAKNVMLDRLRRDCALRIDILASLDDLDVPEASPSTERVAMARSELRWVLRLIDRLPRRCRQVYRARRIHGLSQLETAASLGLSENVVEKEMMKGSRLLAEMICAPAACA